MKRLLLTIIGALSIATAPAHAIMISFQDAGVGSSPGGVVGSQVDVLASDIGDQIVSAFGIVVDYGPLTLLDAAVGDPSLGGPDIDQLPQWHNYSYLSDGFPLGNLAYTDFQDVPGLIGGAGTAYLEDVSLLGDAYLASIQPDNFVLGSLWFDEEYVDLDLLSFVWGPEFDVKGLDARVIYPTSVPEPGTLALLGLGLLGFGALKLRRRTSVTA